MNYIRSISDGQWRVRSVSDKLIRQKGQSAKDKHHNQMKCIISDEWIFVIPAQFDLSLMLSIYYLHVQAFQSSRINTFYYAEIHIIMQFRK